MTQIMKDNAADFFGVICGIAFLIYFICVDFLSNVH